MILFGNLRRYYDFPGYTLAQSLAELAQGDVARLGRHDGCNQRKVGQAVRVDDGHNSNLLHRLEGFHFKLCEFCSSFQHSIS